MVREPRKPDPSSQWNPEAELIVGRCVQMAIEEWVYDGDSPRTIVGLRNTMLGVIRNLRGYICAGPLSLPASPTDRARTARNPSDRRIIQALRVIGARPFSA